jgi:hypothetical protein
MDLTKLSNPARILAIIGLLAFIDSFLPWYSVSEKTVYPGASAAFATSGNAWSMGFGAWFPLLTLLALGVLEALPAFDRGLAVRGGYAAIGVVALVATVIVLLRWATYPSLPAGAAAFIDAGADVGTYFGLLLGVGASAAAYFGFSAQGGTLNTFTEAFKTTPGTAPSPGGNPSGPPSDGPTQ